MLEQDDTDLFKRGQLMNAAFNYLCRDGASLDNMLFVDVDIRISYMIDFEGLLAQHKTVVIPYNNLQLYYLKEKGVYISENKPSYFLNTPDGGVTLFTKDIFLKCNGFSNLYVGWGREDSDFVRRNKVTRVPNMMIHLAHERHQEWLSDAFKRNDLNFKNQTDFVHDGFKQTIADVTIREIQKNIYHYKIKNIDVVPDYKYIDRFTIRIP